MTAVFTDFFRQQLFANLGLMFGKQIEIVYFSSYAAFTDANDTRYTTLRTLADLQNVLGWGVPLTATVAHTVSTSDSGNNRYVIDSNPHVNQAGWATTNVVAAAVILKGGPYGGVSNPIIFVTDSPFGGGTLIRQADSLVALPAANIGNLAWLFGWQTPAAGATQVLPTEGTLSVLRAPPDYEHSHLQHAWLFPQRANMLANPSFELGTNHWRSNGTLTRVTRPFSDAGAWEGSVTGAGTAMKKAPFWLGSTGSASTPNQAMDVPFVLKAKVALPALSANLSLAAHAAGTTNNAWRLYFAGSELRLGLSYTGLLPFDTAGPAVFTAAELDVIANPATPFYVGVQVFTSVGMVSYQGITSSDGLTWTPATPVKNYNVGASAVYVSSAPYTVGDPASGAYVYWCSLEAQQTPLWRFDAATAYLRTSWAGPLGEDWTSPVANIVGTTGAALVMESNRFPTKIGAETSGLWTIQAMVKGTGRVRIGLLSWESDYATTAADWGPDGDVWTLPANGYLHVYALRRSGEGTNAMVRIECEGTDMTLDNVLAEPEWLDGWPYFDGDTKYGALDDFSWYGGKNLKGQTYSLWYNHRRAVVGRLFAWSISDSDFTVTDEEIEAQGFVYKWVPAGVRVIPHTDVLWEGDPQSPVPAVTGAVLPIKTASTDKQGVYPAWAIATP